MLAFLSLCHQCEAPRNWRWHQCDLVVDIEVSHHSSWGNWKSRGSYPTRRYPYRYERYHDVIRDSEGRFGICKQKHKTVAEAEKCGSRECRRLQLGTSRRGLTSIKRSYRKPTGGITPRGPIAGLSDVGWSTLKEIYDHRCYYCGSKSRSLQKEHLIPLARGGTNDISNIVPACRDCNLRKSTLTDQEFITLLRDEAEYAARRKGAGPETQEAPPGHKRCSACKQVLPLDAFGSHSGKRDGLASRCRTCASAASASWRTANAEKDHASRRAQRLVTRSSIKERNLTSPPTTLDKRCAKCGKTKAASEFHRDIYSPDGLQRRCKECRSVDGKS